jgi:two-component system response regulator RegA
MTTRTRQSGPLPSIDRLLIVEDCAQLRHTLTTVFAPRVGSVRTVGSVAEAQIALKAFDPDLLVLDFALPDGDGFDVLTLVAAQERLPAIVAMSGSAAPGEAFRLAQLGVRAFVSKPINLDELEDAVAQSLTSAPDLQPLLRASVGHRSVHDVEDQVRATMVTEALARTEGSKKGAARLLAISRQLLQHILKRDN